jgi:alginate O-acetyltransferase complex protein AlgI
MVFSSFVFLFVFLPATLLCYYSSSNRTWRNVVLLLVSVLFYAWGEPVYVLLMLASTVLNWVLALWMARIPSNARPLLVVGIAVNLLGILVFKYADFIVANLNGVLGLSLPQPHITLPIGISFYTFQAISYLVDVYKHGVKPQPSLVFYGTYHTLFPQLIAGPVVRYATVEHEINERRENVADFANGARRFCMGLGKKVLIANPMGLVADTLLAGGSTIGAIPAWIGFLAYTFQIYFDFSGYSDMAIGLGKMFGFHFLENFEHPYVSRSITEFWRRWHISLSSFFRDYVYFPMGGSRVNRPRLVFNLLFVWSLTGLWHGASWTFVLWGAYYGALLIGEKLLWGTAIKKLPLAIQHLYTICGFVCGWVIFRVEDFSQMGSWFGALCGRGGSGNLALLNALNLLHLWPWFVIAAIGSTPVMRKRLSRLAAIRKTAWLVDVWVLSIFLWSVVELIGSTFNPFIYFRF